MKKKKDESEKGNRVSFISVHRLVPGILFLSFMGLGLLYWRRYTIIFLSFTFIFPQTIINLPLPPK